MTRADLLLAILGAAEGKAFSPVQIQKAAFLITRNVPQIVDQGPAFAFTPYDYGPFDRAVYLEAENLERQGLACVNQMSSRWRTYAATADGVARGRQVLSTQPVPIQEYVCKVSDWVRSLDFATLVKSVYEAYPDTKINSIFQD